MWTPICCYDTPGFPLPLAPQLGAEPISWRHHNNEKYAAMPLRNGQWDCRVPKCGAKDVPGWVNAKATSSQLETDIFTARIRSLREGNVFTLCVCPQGGLVWFQVQCWAGPSPVSGLVSGPGPGPVGVGWGVPRPRSGGRGYPNRRVPPSPSEKNFGEILWEFFFFQFFPTESDPRGRGRGWYASCGHAGGLSCDV